MKKILIWILGVVFTVSVAVYQKVTGPTYPYKEKVMLNGKEFELKFSRSGETTPDDISKPYLMILDLNEPGITAMMQYRRYPTKEDFKTIPFLLKKGRYVAKLPQQPAAGKIEYKAIISDGKNVYEIPRQIIRFKDPVPIHWLAPHIFFMFLAMLFSNVAAFMAIFKVGDLSKLKEGTKGYFKPTNFVGVAVWAAIFLAIGGLWLGPEVQKYAFGEYWTGVPFGWDLTDNKTLIAAIFWAIALFMNFRRPSRFWTVTAAVVMVLIYAIPHSMFGSELDPETGKVIQGMILFNSLGF